MDNKPIPKPPFKPAKKEVVYFLYTLSGTRHYITKEEYEELRARIVETQAYGTLAGGWASQPDTDHEFVLFLRNIEAIGKDVQNTIEKDTPENV
jgi:hypothetical protein